jgi:hypothetical protein
MTSPTLLSLPREIRDIIYIHLSQEIVVDWGFRIRPFPLGGHDVLRLRVSEAPLTSVLLSCTQIYHEYSHNRQFRKPSITINVSEHKIAHMLQEAPTNQARALRILDKTSQIIFLVNGEIESNVPRQCRNIEDLSRSIGLLAPRLETIRVCCKTQHYGALAQPISVDMIDNTAVVLHPDAVAALSQRVHDQRRQRPFDYTNEYLQNCMPIRNALVGEWHVQRSKR